MFDGAVSTSTAGAPAPVVERDDVQLHISMIVNVSKEGSGIILQIICSAWPDEIEIDKVSIRKQEIVLANPYDSPIFKYGIYFCYCFFFCLGVEVTWLSCIGRN